MDTEYTRYGFENNKLVTRTSIGYGIDGTLHIFLTDYTKDCRFRPSVFTFTNPSGMGYPALLIPPEYFPLDYRNEERLGIKPFRMGNVYYRRKSRRHGWIHQSKEWRVYEHSSDVGHGLYNRYASRTSQDSTEEVYYVPDEGILFRKASKEELIERGGFTSMEYVTRLLGIALPLDL